VPVELRVCYPGGGEKVDLFRDKRLIFIENSDDVIRLLQSAGAFLRFRCGSSAGAVLPVREKDRIFAEEKGI